MDKNNNILNKAREIRDILNEIDEVETNYEALRIDNFEVCLVNKVCIKNGYSVTPINFCKDIVMKKLEDELALLEIKLEERMK